MSQHHQHTHDHQLPATPEPVEGSYAPRPSADLVATELDGELLLLDERTDRLHRLDALGALIWNVFDGEVTVEELVGDLSGIFETPADTVRADLVGLVEGLRATALLDGYDPPADELVGASAITPAGGDGLWRPSYLVDPPAP